MGRNQRNHDADRNKGGSFDPRRRRQLPIQLEGLEDRRLLAASAWKATSTDIYDVQNGPMANIGASLIYLYRDFANNGAHTGYTPIFKDIIQTRGTTVGVDVRASGSLASLQQAVATLGMKVTATSPSNNMVEGFIPIANLPQLATNAAVRSASPILVPKTNAAPNAYPFQGIGNNQSANTLNVPLNVQAGVVNGTGQKVGVLSDSVSLVGGGIADSIRTGDLATSPQIIQEGDDGEDEGRAMLEQIHDIAPGAQLGFATAGGGAINFASNITQLAMDGYNTIVDDIGYGDEPAFQDGIIQQAINTVTSNGATFLSAAGNASDDGYLTQFRGVNATVGSLGAGRYMNFDPNGGTQTQLGLYVPDNARNSFLPVNIYLQFDQPVGAVSSNVVAYLLDSNGNVAYMGLSDPFAEGQPLQILVNAAGTSADVVPGSYTLVVKVVSGADPGHIFSYNFGNGDAAFDKSFGSAGGTFYPTTFGHAAGASTIGVAAVPYYGAAPYPSTTTNNNEPFSSFGPVYSVINADGTYKSAPQILLKPDLSAPDGNNTSFFGDPAGFPTTLQRSPVNPSYPGNPPTTTGSPTTTINYNQNLPNFYGTSSAAPNLAAVVALLKQVNPAITNQKILSSLITSTTPLNGAAKGVWNAQGGFGLADATLALAAAQVLAVVSVSPGAGQVLTQVPTTITVTFSQPVNINTVANSLVVIGPTGVTVNVGAPIGVNSATFPTVVTFPISFTRTPGAIANGVFTVSVRPGSIVAQDGTTLTTPFTTTFNLQQLVAPTVVQTAYNGRFVAIRFSEAIDPTTLNLANLYLFRANGVNNALFNAGDVIVTNFAGVVLTYDPTTFTALINLTAVPQSQLLTDQYALVATAGITDSVGNPLNGAFNGVFPSGVLPSGSGSNFIQSLGVITLQAPLVSSLALAAATDTGVQGDSDTSISRPSFIGQITAIFPNTNANLLVYVQFNGINHVGLAPGGLNLGVGVNGRGVVGQYDAVVTTDAFGRFVVNYPAGFASLPEGQNIIRVVAVGATDQAPAGLSSAFNTTFQVDRTLPYVGTLNGTSPTSVLENSSINNLTTLSILVVDPVNPSSRTSPFGVNPQSKVLALDPSSVGNISNYSLFLITPTGQIINESGFIKTANLVSTSVRVLATDPFTGRIDLTLAPGLPTGRYVFFMNGPGTNYLGQNVLGVTDAAGNSITATSQNSATGTALPFVLNFNLQPTPTYITNYGAYSVDGFGNSYGSISSPRAAYEVPAPGVTPSDPAPPTAFTLDFSNQLAAMNYASRVQLVRSANTATSLPDGDFGNFGTAAGLTNPTGFSQVSGLSVTLVNSISNATLGQSGYLSRLFITLSPGTTLTPDYYRLYLPNGNGTQITDNFGNQLDGEFLGFQNAAGKYVDQLNDGTLRGVGAFDQPDLSGNGVAGGAFMTGFVVVPNGNVIFARPDAIYNPQLPGSFPDGSRSKPYPVLAPEATFTALNGGDLNSVVNSGVNFNPNFDFSGLGTFQPSAFFAAQEKARLTLAPVVIVAEPAFVTRDPISGIISQRPFVLQAPQNDPTFTDGSAAVPAMTTLLLAAGSTLKMQNAALLVQNQGSALQIMGGPNSSQIVTVTSYKDSSIGGATNGDPSSTPAPGDYGGILFRNYNEAAGGSAGRSSLFPGQIPITGSISSDGRLKGPFTSTTSRTSQLDAISGADPIMSYLNYLVEKYAGGNVPQSSGVVYDGITLQNSRPTIINSTISLSGGVGAAVAGLSVDVDSLKLDDVAGGPLIRGDVFLNNGLNGIYVRAQVSSGLAEATNSTLRTGSPNSYIFNNPYPYLFTSRLTIGEFVQVETGGAQTSTADRLYVSPGMLLKFQQGSGVAIQGRASINVGDTTYINEYDASLADPINQPLNPGSAGFKANSSLLANALFTSLDDDVATTTFTDPQTGAIRTVVAPLPATSIGSGSLQPIAGTQTALGRWGGISIVSGAVAVLNSTIFRYGGGAINVAGGTGTQHVLEVGGGAQGARVSITNNTFLSNADVPINLQPDSLLAGDASRPLSSGDPFIHGNVFIGNTINGVGVQGGTTGGFHVPNLDYNSVLDRVRLHLRAPQHDRARADCWARHPTPSACHRLHGDSHPLGHVDSSEHSGRNDSGGRYYRGVARCTTLD